MSFYQNSDHLENTDLLEAKRAWYTISKFQLRMGETSAVVNSNTAYWIAAKIKPFLTISIQKFSFLCSSMFVLFLENILPKLNAYANIRIIALFFWIGNIFIILLSTYLENTGRNNILCVKMLLLRNKSHGLISMIEAKVEM